uniref:EF-hand domain-containing protein n=1 Tax=Panagrolaimus sp. PS1159 TaxID=55785 RepID=A0AC35FQB5_9BILA
MVNRPKINKQSINYMGKLKISPSLLKILLKDVEIDVEDLLTNPFNTQPPSLDELQRLTGFRRDWLMFVYRNFKQTCSNGRMSQGQWRGINRLIFKGATDYEFADRFFMAIAGSRSQKLITFEDLIFCLYDICSSLNRQPGCSSPPENSQLSSTSVSVEQFTFNLMMPDQHGRVDEAGFVKYAKSVFNLNASISDCSGDAATFGMFHQISNNTNSQSAVTDKSGSSSNKSGGGEKISAPWIGCFARKQFRTLDVDADGYITLEDIQRVFEQKVFYESLYLRPESHMLFKPFQQLHIQENE